MLWGAQVQSTMGTTALEDVARAAAGSPWLIFQLYVLASREFTRGLVQRATLHAYEVGLGLKLRHTPAHISAVYTGPSASPCKAWSSVRPCMPLT